MLAGEAIICCCYLEDHYGVESIEEEQDPSEMMMDLKKYKLVKGNNISSNIT